ncbi:MAG: septum formation initiator family protein [Pleurocapsa minor GSE-CHR-MK-17-07R]|jgi:cell division protein FtsB|nr:septum formation initiator family protein [Pleurocapsa minor GSE-CHR-MK 17-07R]
MIDKSRFQETSRPTGQFSGIQIMFAAIIAIGLFLAIDFSNRISASQPMEEAYDRVQREIAALREQQAALIEQRDTVRGDAYVAQWARSEGRMALPGELLVIPVPAGNVAAAAPIQAAPTPVPQEIIDSQNVQEESWTLWWALFFDSPPPDF